jgi:hypothetical protein
LPSLPLLKPAPGARSQTLLGLRSIVPNTPDPTAWVEFRWTEKRHQHDPRIALAYAAKIETLIGQPGFVQS